MLDLLRGCSLSPRPLSETEQRFCEPQRELMLMGASGRMEDTNRWCAFTASFVIQESILACTDAVRN